MKSGWKTARKKSASKRKRHGASRNNDGLESKIDRSGGRNGFGLEESSDQEDDATTKEKTPGLYGNRSTSGLSGPRRVRLFQTPATQKTVASTEPNAGSVQSQSKFSLSSKPSSANPYKKDRNQGSRSSGVVASRLSTNQRRVRTIRSASAVHIVCAISENLARETCVASLDAGSPVTLHITKQANGLTYAETLAYLEVLQPHEVLLNEGRRNSQLTNKILELYNVPSGQAHVLTFDRKQGKKAQAESRAAARRKRLFPKSTAASGDDDNNELGAADGPCATSVVVKVVPRSYFDQTKGAETIRRVARKETFDWTLLEEYILLSSAHAVLQYTSLCLGANFSPSCLELIVNTGGGNRMTIDRSSLVNLELLANAKTGKMANSLIGTIDCTKTTVGSRLLRTNLMAPPIRTDTINARLDLVDVLLGDEEFFYNVMGHLEELPDVDKMLTNIALVPWKKGNKIGSEETEVTARIASKGISALVCIKSILSAIPAFAQVLEDKLNALELEDGPEIGPAEVHHRDDDSASVGSELDEEARNDSLDATSTITGGSSLLIGLGGGPMNDTTENCPMNHHLLRAIVATMKQPALAEALTAVTDIFMESTTFTRNAHAMRHQECFALKQNEDGMMDVVRKAFLANVDDIYRLADEYAETHEMTVTVKETTSRGYYLSVPVDAASELPSIFIQPVKSGRFVFCTTEQIHSLNARAQENIEDLLIMTHEKIQEVLDEVRARYDALASLSDAIALLDMCHCFADNVASSRMPWCRPVVTDGPAIIDIEDAAFGANSANPRAGSGGDIAIRNGRYGIDVKGTGLMVADENSPEMTGDFIPNDTFASEYHNFTVVTGINGSGKTLYLKQIAITVVLAHCGSYVPAEEAFIPVRDRLCTRIGTADDQEHNISTFMLEMKETAFICNNATEKSLILVDELGRATSNEDGVAMTWAVSEYLLEKRSMTFFVTHYPQLSMLSNVYHAAQNQHMSAKISGKEETEIQYSFKILPGPCEAGGDYGVEMAATCGWPSDAVAEARELRKEIDHNRPDGSLCHIEPGSGIDLYRTRWKAGEALHVLFSHLVTLQKTGSGLSVDAKRGYLQDLRTRLIPDSDAELIDNIKSTLRDEPLPPIPMPSESKLSRSNYRANSVAHQSDDPQLRKLTDKTSIVVNDADAEKKDTPAPVPVRNGRRLEPGHSTKAKAKKPYETPSSVFLNADVPMRRAPKPQNPEIRSSEFAAFPSSEDSASSQDDSDSCSSCSTSSCSSNSSSTTTCTSSSESTISTMPVAQSVDSSTSSVSDLD